MNPRATQQATARIGLTVNAIHYRQLAVMLLFYISIDIDEYHHKSLLSSSLL